jgi:hypothetical protein
MDEVVRNFMDAYRVSRSRDPVVITDQIDVRSWVLTSFQPVKFDFNDVVRTVMRYRPDVLDTNRPGFLRLEILLEMADASRWRLYPQAIPIQEWPHQIAALEGPAESRAAVFGRWHEMVAAAAIDRLGHRKAEQWLPLKFLEEWLSVAVGDRRQSEVAVGINVTNGDKFQWYRHFSCYSAADFTALTRRPVATQPADVRECWLVLLGAPQPTIPGSAEDPTHPQRHYQHSQLLWVLHFTDRTL